MKPINPIWVNGINGTEPFKYVPSWQSARPGYLAEKFRKMQKQMQKRKEMEANAPSEEQ